MRRVEAIVCGSDTVPAATNFAVRLAGDSMAPRYVDKQIVYVEQKQTLDCGEVGVFLLNGDAYCKVLAGEKEPVLLSINPKYMPIKITDNDDFRVLGKVVN